MNKITNNRKKIYLDLFANNKNVYKNREILLLFNIKPKLFNNLKKSVQKYIGKKYPLGHVGTLDPLAEGVLPIVFGRATKIQDFIDFESFF